MQKNDYILISFGQKLTFIASIVCVLFSNILLAEDKVIFGITGVALKEDIVTMKQWSTYIAKKLSGSGDKICQKL